MEKYIKEKTTKFKNISVDLRFSKAYDAKERTSLLLLGRFLTTYSQKYQDKYSMRKIKDMLYGIKTYAGVRVNGSLMTLILSFQFVNPKYLRDIDSKDYIDFIDECIMHPFFSENLFNEIKDNFKADIKRYLEKPRNMESENLIKEIAEDHPSFMQYSKDAIDIIDTLSLDDLKKTYHDLFNEYSVDCFLVGDYDETLDEYLKKYTTNDLSFYQEDEAYVSSSKEDIIISKSSDQSYLSLVYQTPYTRKHKDYYAFLMTNIMFGGSPLSLLFSEVREVKGLCYSIGCIPYRNEGLVRVTTGIDQKNLEIVKQAINDELAKLQNGDFDVELLEASKRLTVNNILSINDDVEEYISFLFSNAISRYPIGIEDYIKAINTVTKEDIIRVSKEYRPYLCHFLKGENHE